LVFDVVDGEGEDFADALVDARLAGPDFADARQQLVEVVGQRVAPLEAFVVEGETFDEVLAQPLRGPLAELDAPGRAHAVADGEDHVEVVELKASFNLAAAFGSNL
jgi:hypothetical protein